MRLNLNIHMQTGRVVSSVFSNVKTLGIICLHAESENMRRSFCLIINSSLDLLHYRESCVVDLVLVIFLFRLMALIVCSSG